MILIRAKIVILWFWSEKNRDSEFSDQKLRFIRDFDPGEIRDLMILGFL